MSSLADLDKSRVRYHLAYNESVPTGDRALLEKRMTRVADSYTVGKLVDQLARCDRAKAETETDEQSSGITSKRILLGDVNRTDVNFQVEPIEKRLKAYLRDCNDLAKELGVRNWRDPELDGYRSYSDTITDPQIPAPVEITINLTLGTDVYLYFA